MQKYDNIKKFILILCTGVLLISTQVFASLEVKKTSAQGRSSITRLLDLQAIGAPRSSYQSMLINTVLQISPRVLSEAQEELLLFIYNEEKQQEKDKPYLRSKVREIKQLSGDVNHNIKLEFDHNGIYEHYTLLIFAAQIKNCVAIKVLVEEGALVNKKKADKQTTALHYSARAGDMCSLDFLLKHGANVDTYDVAGCSPLHYALSNEQTESSHRLVEAGADINRLCQITLTSLDLALYNRNIENLNLLINHPDIIISDEMRERLRTEVYHNLSREAQRKVLTYPSELSRHLNDCCVIN